MKIYKAKESLGNEWTTQHSQNGDELECPWKVFQWNIRTVFKTSTRYSHNNQLDESSKQGGSRSQALQDTQSHEPTTM